MLVFLLLNVAVVGQTDKKIEKLFEEAKQKHAGNNYKESIKIRDVAELCAGK